LERLAILIAAEFAINIGASGTALAMTRLMGLALGGIFLGVDAITLESR